MEAERELDALVAEKVMGWTHAPSEPLSRYWYDEEGRDIQLKEFSTDIADAWEVVEEMKKKDAQFKIEYYRGHSKIGGDPYTALFILGNIGSPAQSFSASHAICLAALKAVGHSFT